MKYVIDTEFIEGFHKPLFGKRRHFIDLISIAIVAEDGREYYAISSEYNYKDASQWVRDNVILPAYLHTVSGGQRNFSDPHNFHKRYGKPNSIIAEEIIRFVNPHLVRTVDGRLHEPVNEDYARKHNIKTQTSASGIGTDYIAQPEFWAYYADYDWVLFCSLFETMNDLLKGFPMYCLDLVHEVSAIGAFVNARGFQFLAKDGKTFTLERKENQHIALYDARWGMDLLRFITG